MNERDNIAWQGSLIRMIVKKEKKEENKSDNENLLKMRIEMFTAYKTEINEYMNK